MRNLTTLTPADFLGIIRRRLWYCVITTLLVTAAALFAVSRMQKIYKSEARIMLTGRILTEGFLPKVSDQTDRVEQAKQQLQSTSFLSRIVEEFQFANKLDGPRFERVVNAVKSSVEITPVHSTAFLLGYYASDPVEAQSVAQRLAEMVIQTNERDQKGISQQGREWLEGEMRQAMNDLADREADVNDFRRLHFPGLAPGDDSLDGVRTMRSEIAALDTRLQVASTTRKSLDRRLIEETRPRTTGRLGTLAAPTAPVASQVPARLATTVTPASGPAPLVAPSAPILSAPVLSPTLPSPARPATLVQVAPPPPRQATPLELTLAARKADLDVALRRYTDKSKVVIDLKEEIKGLEERVGQARKIEDAQNAQMEAERRRAEELWQAELVKQRKEDFERQQQAAIERERAVEAQRKLLEDIDKRRVAEAERQRAAEIARLTAERERQLVASRGETPGKQTSIAAVAEDPLEKYDREVRERNIAEIKAQMQELDSEIRGMENQKKTLSDRLSLSQNSLNPTGELAKQMSDLIRSRDLAQQKYRFLENRLVTGTFSANLDSNSENGTFRIIDPAFLPQTAVRPNRPMLAAFGCLAGLLAGFAAAIGRELLDPSVHTEAEAVAILKLPILAGIPMLAETKKPKQLAERRLASILAAGDDPRAFTLESVTEKIREVLIDPYSTAAEPYRFMNNKLLLMQKERNIKTVLITSAIQGEGKTFSACCLAGILARETGRRVLLIDGDLRTGSASEAMGLTSALNGLHQLLRKPHTGPAGSSLVPFTSERAPLDLDQVVTRCTDMSLDFLPSGTDDEHRSQLSSTPDLERLLKRAEKDYDWVIIDSPPILAMADAALLAPLCDATVLVVGSGKTSSALVKEAIDRVGIQRICGLLLNRLRPGNHSYHSYYKRIPQKQMKG